MKVGTITQLCEIDCNHNGHLIAQVNRVQLGYVYLENVFAFKGWFTLVYLIEVSVITVGILQR
jgi:hypothetical protein